jgi:hypothetical protein
MKITVQTSARVRNYPTDAAKIRPCGHACSKKNKKKIKINLVVVAGLKREKKNFGFRFSIPKIPELRRLCGRSREKKKVFSA